MTGWGARLGRLSAQGKWSRKERTRHINFLELTVVHLALQLWQGQMTQKVISVQMDNTTAVAYLIKEGGAQSPVLSDLASKILILAGRHNIVLRPTYLPGLLNMEADALSRQKDSAEWMLTTSVARKLFLVLGYPVVDLFASARTKQVRQYFTTDRHDHRALGTDALHHKWEFRGSPLYAFPPPMLIPLVLARIHQYKTVMIIVTPWWPRSLGVHRSAIATLLQPLSERTIGSDKAVSLFMRAIYLSRPPERRLRPIWDVSSVLRCIEAWGDIADLNRSRLTHRLVMPLTLASARRVSDLFLLRTDNPHLQRLPTKWSFLVAFGAKQERPNHSVPPIVFEKNLECPRLCPILHLEDYLQRTDADRSGSSGASKLWWTTVPPFRPVAKATIARWLVNVLKEAGSSDSAGSTRAAAATWSAAKGVKPSTIMAAADWTAARTMRNHYIRLLPRSVLEHQPTVQDVTLALWTFTFIVISINTCSYLITCICFYIRVDFSCSRLYDRWGTFSH